MLRLDESDPIVVSEKVVRRIMREGAMRPVYLKRPKRWSSYAGEIGEAPANLVERDFHADAPNMLWVTDVTQFTMDGYKCWLSRWSTASTGWWSPGPCRAPERRHGEPDAP